MSLGVLNPVICTNIVQGFASTPATNAVTTLFNTSMREQYFTGTANQTVVLPAVATLQNGYTYSIVNLSTGTVTIQTALFNVVTTVSSNSQHTAMCFDNTGVGGLDGWFVLQTAYVVTTSAGGNITAGNYSSTTVGAVNADFCTINSTSGPAGTSYIISATIVLGSAPSSGGMYNLYCRAKNILGTVTILPPLLNGVSLDIPLAPASVDIISSGADIIIRVTGVAARTIEWYGKVEVISQTF